VSITATHAFQGVYEADVNHSSFEAGARHMGVGSFRTRFEDVTARLSADESGLRLEGRAAVESISIRNPPEFREHVVNGADFFDAPHHPEITFASDQIELHDGGTLELTGRLTIKGTTRALRATGSYRLPLEDPYGNLRSALDLQATIDRREFGIDWQARLPGGGNALEWDIALAVHLELVQG